MAGPPWRKIAINVFDHWSKQVVLPEPRTLHEQGSLYVFGKVLG
jgi:hypothetical protein